MKHRGQVYFGGERWQRAQREVSGILLSPEMGVETEDEDMLFQCSRSSHDEGEVVWT